MYELHSIKQGKPRWSFAYVPLVHHGIKFYFRCGEDFYKMTIGKVYEKTMSIRCNRGKCNFALKVSHSFETVQSSRKSNRRFADTVTKEQLLNIANYRFEKESREDHNHRLLCKMRELSDISDVQMNKASNKQTKTSLPQEAQSSATISSSEIGTIPPELQFLLHQTEVAVDITDNCTEFEFTAEEILSGGELATMIILSKPAFQTE